MAQIEIRVPTPLRSYTGGNASIHEEGADVGQLLDKLTTRFPGLRRHLFTPEGKLRNFVIVYVNGQDVRYLERDRTAVRSGDTVSIVPAIAGGSGEVAEMLSPEEMRRYSRHLLLNEVGVSGQKRLRRSKVLLVGAGGLGAPSALYLAAAGVGEIGLIDFDRVEASNLQRQVLYSTADVGRPKLEAAADRLHQLNPGVRVVPHEMRLDSTNVLDVVGRYDVVVDGTDNFPTRYLVNDACVLLGKPNVYGSIYRFEGQASVFDARRGPCYRCLYSEPPPPGLVPSCAEGGVLGVLPGIVGTIQALETVKLLLGIGEPLIGRLLLFDALSMEFRQLTLRKNPDCVICSDHPTQKGLIDYAAFCGVPEPGSAPVSSGVPEVTAQELHGLLAAEAPPYLLDVREPGEWEIAHLPGAHLIPQGTLPDRVTELTQAQDLVVYCKSGARSARATQYLIDLGFTHVRNLKGGIDAWGDDVDPSMPRY